MMNESGQNYAENVMPTAGKTYANEVDNMGF